MVKYISAVLLFYTASVWAVCSTVSTDGNTRLRGYAQQEWTQFVEEFQKGNTIRACEHLKISRSYIKQTDEKIAAEYITVLYNKTCEVK